MRLISWQYKDPRYWPPTCGNVGPVAWKKWPTMHQTVADPRPRFFHIRLTSYLVRMNVWKVSIEMWMPEFATNVIKGTAQLRSRVRIAIDVLRGK